MSIIASIYDISNAIVSLLVICDLVMSKSSEKTSCYKYLYLYPRRKVINHIHCCTIDLSLMFLKFIFVIQ